jgi:hypothetical protein
MSLCFAIDSTLSEEKTRQRLAETKDKFSDILEYFWISEVRPASSRDLDDDLEYGFIPKCAFMIQWNNERPELVALIPKIFYETFGNDLLIRDNNYDVIPPP